MYRKRAGDGKLKKPKNYAKTYIFAYLDLLFIIVHQRIYPFFLKAELRVTGAYLKGLKIPSKPLWRFNMVQSFKHLSYLKMVKALKKHLKVYKAASSNVESLNAPECFSL